MGIHCRAQDIKNKFLNWNLEEEVYMEIPSEIKKNYGSKKSSAKSKLRALVVMIWERVWIRRIMEKLGMEFGKTVKIKCDNQATINIAKDPVHHDLTKHVTIDRHFIVEKIENFQVKVIYTLSREQCVDILTKALQGPNLERLYNKLGMYNMYNLT
ncbi:Cysteine-rich RLK (RECEPTOR-like protein kinase) 8 [Gossypium australe]|uniref:Cysteine-rich RLK (RECEPTOR-like protein kinase) 8 n=1 Tax=Gossypium australe TaxID=47621 RepID=A0A5B6W4A8_9ROSI|nr:Cysteine-rich RLK (RECEPTOR-like protein kinase) 8 [Gossypium australe]